MPPRSRSGTPSPPRTRSGGVPSASAPPFPQHPPRRRSRPDGSGAAAGVAVTTATAATHSGGPPRSQSSRSLIPAGDASIPPRLPSASPAPRSLRTGSSVVDGDGDRGSHALLPHAAVFLPPPALPSPSFPSHSGCAPPLHASPPATFSTSPHPPLLPRRRPLSGRVSGPSARRRTIWRGGLFLEGNRPVPSPQAISAKINVIKDGDLGLSTSDYRLVKQLLSFAIKHILGSTAPFCEHADDKLRSAVAFLEEREPRMAVRESGWGACSLLSRSLQNRRPTRRRRDAPAVATREASTAAGDGDGTDTGDGDVSPALGTEEQRLAQQRLNFLNQLE